MVIALRHNHNHSILSEEALRHRPVPSDVQAEFSRLFASGLSPMQAISVYRTRLEQRYGDTFQEVTNLALILANLSGLS